MRNQWIYNSNNTNEHTEKKDKKLKPRKPPGAFTRIVRDSTKSLLHDAPEALADALPWVDKSQKAEPISEVLSQVVDDLSRAAAQDPEWVNPAQRELRDLAKRLSTLSPPPMTDESVPNSGASRAANLEKTRMERSFRPRPIWPGASVQAEAQSRPATVVTYTGLDLGPQSEGQSLPFVAEKREGEATTPKPRPKKSATNRPSRRSP
ncbi:hypothetical protein PsB1_0076 [Candidatus Phycosocius spiralis]|uniref:Uncharacterized protein n=2 Tax=Candidatus Phycosocius spiralis TaxID=2815099 RepID=A0ABQ4PSE6_9PROT|nr:hypothetical protein PsB1_0076 [Candidatus Phycosocius spiralis]